MTDQIPKLQQLRADLRPGAIASNLMGLSLATILHAMIKDSIVEEVRGFYDFGSVHDHQGQQMYDKAVRKTRSEFKDCLAWLQENQALDAEDEKTIERLHELRNLAAHEGAKTLIDPDGRIAQKDLDDGAEVLRKLGVFWGGIAADTDPQFDHEEIDYDGIRSGFSLLFEHVLDVSKMMMKAGEDIDLEIQEEERAAAAATEQPR